MDSIQQREIFLELGNLLNYTFEFPSTTLKWVKTRKNLQVACFEFGPYRWEKNLFAKNIKFRTTASWLFYLNQEVLACCCKFIEEKMDQDVGELFLCSEGITRECPAYQLRFLTVFYKKDIAVEQEKEKEAKIARDFATALRQLLRHGPQYTQAFFISKNITVYRWAGLLSTLEKDFLENMPMRRAEDEMDIIFHKIFINVIQQMDEECLSEKTRFVFSERMIDDKGLIIVIKE